MVWLEWPEWLRMGGRWVQRRPTQTRREELKEWDGLLFDRVKGYGGYSGGSPAERRRAESPVTDRHAMEEDQRRQRRQRRCGRALLQRSNNDSRMTCQSERICVCERWPSPTTASHRYSHSHHHGQSVCSALPTTPLSSSPPIGGVHTAYVCGDTHPLSHRLQPQRRGPSHSFRSSRDTLLMFMQWPHPLTTETSSHQLAVMDR